MIFTKIKDGGSGKALAKVTSNGQVVTGNLSFDDVVYKELAADDTAYNFYQAKAGKQFVITGVVAKADKQVSTTVDADVIIYEAGAEDTTTVDKTLFQTAMVSGDLVQLTGLNILVNEGKFVNAKTTDDDVHMTIMGYFVNKVE